MTRLNDSVLLWAGESTAPARLLPDGLTYQCVIRSPEGVMAEQGVQYRFSVTPVNSVGPAVKPFTFTSSFSPPPPPPPPPPLEKVVKKDTGGDLVVKQWDQANSVTSSASAVNSRGSSQVNRIVMAFHSMEQSGQKVASFLLQNVVTFPAAAIMALLVGAYFLALFSFQAARLRYARHVIYNQFTGMQTGDDTVAFTSNDGNITIFFVACFLPIFSLPSLLFWLWEKGQRYQAQNHTRRGMFSSSSSGRCSH